MNDVQKLKKKCKKERGGKTDVKMKKRQRNQQKEIYTGCRERRKLINQSEKIVKRTKK